MAITDATVIAFSNDVIRPLADCLTGLYPYLTVEITRWNDQIKPLMTGDLGSDALVDGAGPDGDGRVPLIKNDLTKFFTQIEFIADLIGGSSVTQTVSGEEAFEDIMKPHVNPKFPG